MVAHPDPPRGRTVLQTYVDDDTFSPGEGGGFANPRQVPGDVQDFLWVKPNRKERRTLASVAKRADLTIMQMLEMVLETRR